MFDLDLHWSPPDREGSRRVRDDLFVERCAAGLGDGIPAVEAEAAGDMHRLSSSV